MTKEISESRNPSTFDEHAQVASEGGSIARNARLELEDKTGKKVITSQNAKDVLEGRLNPELPFDDNSDKE